MGEAPVPPAETQSVVEQFRPKHGMAVLMLVPAVRVHSRTKGHRYPAHIRKCTSVLQG